MDKDKIRVVFERTPNPSTMKFVFPKPFGSKSAEFASVQDAHESPLAMKLFGFPWTQAVYLCPEFVSVTKADWLGWEILLAPLENLLSEHLSNQEPLWTSEIKAHDSESSQLARSQSEHSNSEALSKTQDPLLQEIKKVLDRDIRPGLVMDGGDLAIVSFDQGILAIKMKGACVGCPSSTVTLKQGIEARLKEIFPQVKKVVSV